MAFEDVSPEAVDDVLGENSRPAGFLSPFTPEDLEYLKARAVPEAMAAAAGLRGVSGPEATALLGRAVPVGSAGIVIPYPGVTPPYHRIRLHDAGAAGARYLTLPGREVPLYTVPQALRKAGTLPGGLDDVLVAVEAPIKALALAAVGLDAVGLSGTSTTLDEQHGVRRLNSSWPRHRVAGKPVVLLFDAGRANNPAVARDEARLARVLSEAGAMVRVARLPLSQDGEDQGPDDFLARHGAAALYAVLSAAVPAAPVDRVQAQVSGGAADLLDDLPFMNSILEASPGVAAKTREALLAAGLTKSDINTAIKDAKNRATRSVEGDGPALGDHLGVENGRICKLTGGSVPLCNFNASIVQEHVLDDGAVQERTIKIEGSLEDGTPLPAITMKAEELTDPKWSIRHWGTKAIVAGAKLAGDDLRLAIQKLSSPTVTRTYAHTGWRKLTDATGAESGLPVFLHAGGALGGTGVSVRLEDRLAMYRLPDAPFDPAEAVRLSLQLLDVAPLEVMVPLVGMVYRAVLQTALPADFSGLLVGKTGSLKTSIAKLMAAHFGQRLADHPATTFQASVASIEMVLNLLKDVLVLLDDYKPRNAADGMHGKAHAVFSSIGDQEGRGRMQQDGNVRAARPPRALVLATGETPPAGESTVARLLLLNLDRGTVDMERLGQAQAMSHRLPHAMAAYLAWLQPRMPGIEQELRRKHTELRARFEKSGAGGHLRAPSALAHIALGYEYLLPFAEEVGAIEPSRATTLRAEVFSTLETLGKKGASTARDTDPVARFLDFLRGLIEQGKVLLEKNHAAELGQRRESEGPIGEPIGWEGDDHLFLLGEAAYSAVKKAMEVAGVDLPHGDRVLWRRLCDCKLIEPGDREGRLTVREQLGGQRREVIALKKVAVWPSGDDGPGDGGGGGAQGGGRRAPAKKQSDSPDFSDANQTSEPADWTKFGSDRTSGTAGTAGGGGGQVPGIAASDAGTRASGGPVGPVGPLKKEEKKEENEKPRGDSPPLPVSVGVGASIRALPATGPTGPGSQPAADTQDSSAHSCLELDQLGQLNRETVADGLPYLRLSGAGRDPVWCLGTAEQLLGLETKGAVAARRKDLEARLAAAGLARIAQLEFDLLPVVADMERAGLGVDAAAWGELVKGAEAEMADAKEALAALGLKHPEDDAQVRAALAARGMVVTSTSGKALAAHAGDPLVVELRRYRQAAGFYWSTGRPVQQALRRGRVHATINPLSAPTGRMSCSRPNLLSIPKAPAYRRCIVPPAGHRLVVADYSAIELRVLAEITGDAALRKVFFDGGDPHAATAGAILRKPVSTVTQDERQRAKAVNFGFAFGMGPAKFIEYAADFGIVLTFPEAEALRSTYLAAYPSVAEWQRKTRADMRLEVRTRGGRRRIFESKVAGYTERLNTPVQGTAADGLKLAMVLLHRRLPALGARLVLAIHDELLVEAPEATAEQVRALVERTMVDAMSHFIPSVPVKVTSSARPNWAEPIDD